METYRSKKQGLSLYWNPEGLKNRLLGIALIVILAAMFAPTDLIRDRGKVLKGLIGSYQKAPDPNSNNIRCDGTPITGDSCACPCTDAGGAGPVSGPNSFDPIPSPGGPSAAGIGANGGPGTAGMGGEGGPGKNKGPSFPDPVDLARGWEENDPDPDLTVYSPATLPVSFQRTFSESQADTGYGSDGLSPGWVHNFDYAVAVDGSSNTQWLPVYMMYPTGGYDLISPTSQPASNYTGNIAFTGTGIAYAAHGNGTGSGYNLWNDFFLTFRDGTLWEFIPSASGSNVLLLRSITPLVGNGIILRRATTYPYQVTSITTGSTTLMTLAYNTGPQLSQVTDDVDTGGRYVGYTFDGNGNLSNVSELSSATSRWTYGYTTGTASHYLLNSVAVPTPNTGSGTKTATITYDTGDDKVQYLTDANNNTKTFSYNYNSTTETRVDIRPPSGGSACPTCTPIESYIQKYDGSNRSTGVITDLTYNYQTYISYGDAHNPQRPTSIQDQSGRTTTITYDGTNGYGNVQSIKYPSYSGGGNQVAQVFTYNYSNVSYPLGEVTQVQTQYQNSSGGVLSSLSATTYAYNSLGTNYGMLTGITAPAPYGSGVTGGTVTTTIAYTSTLHQPSTITAPGPSVSGGTAATTTTTFNYGTTELMGQPSSIVVTGSGGAASVTTSYTYTSDNRGNVYTYTDGAGNVTTYTYNVANQPTQVKYPATGQTGTGQGYTSNSYAYPDGPLLTSQLYDEGNNPSTAVRKTAYTYGPEGELTQVQRSSPLTTGTETASYTYTPAYHVASITSGNSGTTTNYIYNTLGQLTQAKYPRNGTGYTSYDTLGYSYNPDETLHILTTGNEVGSTTDQKTYSYDATTGLPTGNSYNWGSLSSVSLTYDSYNRPASEGNGNVSKSYTLDGGNYLESTSSSFTGGPSSEQITYNYQPDGQAMKMTVPGYPSNPFTYSYDAIGRLSSLLNPLSETSSWTYNGNSLITQETLANTSYTTYAYDALSRLESLQGYKTSGTAAVGFSGTWGTSSNSMKYDMPGNLLEFNATTTYPGTVTYTYDGVDRQLTESNTRNGSSSWTSAFDADGNATTFRGTSQTFNGDDQKTTDTYDGDGNPTTYQTHSGTYDGEDRLSSWNGVTAAYDTEGLRSKKVGSATAFYLTDENGEQVEELNSSGTVTALNTIGTQGLVSRYTSASTFYLYDLQGSVVNRLNSIHTVISSDLYDGWGNLQAGGSTTDPVGFGGQLGYYTDHENSLLLLGHRYYDPTRGTFVNRDPIGYNGGINLYSYVGESPVTHSDPNGLLPDSSIGNNPEEYELFAGDPEAPDAASEGAKNVRGSRNPNINDKLREGREEHLRFKEEMCKKGHSTERWLPNAPKRLQPDAVDWDNRIIHELKPNNPQGIRRGIAQLEKYAAHLEHETGDLWHWVLHLY